MASTSEKSRPPLPPGPYLVVGLARSGQAAARLLAANGEEVAGCDAGSPPGAAELAAVGVEVALESDGLAQLERARCLVKSPGVPRGAPIIAAALRRRLPVLGELELAWRQLPNRFLAVTGTNGKTTVCELLGHIWRTAGRSVVVAGNVGTPLAALAGRVDDGTLVVAECSSFQLEDADRFAPECGVLLNISPDHSDRHPSPAEYLQAKLRLFANQGPDDLSIYNGSDPALAGVELGGRGRRIAFCRRNGGGGGCHAEVTAKALVLAGEPLLELSELFLPGPHNADNAAAAAAAAQLMGIGRDAIAAGLRDFPGVPHRLERVAVRGGVAYVNDSKATNAAAASAALASFEPGTVRAILGGSLKGEGFGALAGPVAEACRACYLVGEAAERLERDLAAAWEQGVGRRRCGDLGEAVRAASGEAQPGDVVLLAPACASFDAYRDFEQRGEHFRSLVAALEGA